jgi:hypothetical protein
MNRCFIDIHDLIKHIQSGGNCEIKNQFTANKHLKKLSLNTLNRYINKRQAYPIS